jgi:hypothetical protein
MGDNVADIVIHIDETLAPARLKLLADAIRGVDGVVSAGAQDDTPHLITVLYNPDNVNSQAILDKVIHEGCHAKLVGI